uniref:Uncharacterized protein n=1 Tax=Caenorhabditis japonica TaxID=281687 RepID=A0A8R1IJI9_CAEJA
MEHAHMFTLQNWVISQSLLIVFRMAMLSTNSSLISVKKTIVCCLCAWIPGSCTLVWQLCYKYRRWKLVELLGRCTDEDFSQTTCECYSSVIFLPNGAKRRRVAGCVGRRDEERSETQRNNVRRLQRRTEREDAESSSVTAEAKRSSVRRPQRRRPSGDAEKQCASAAEIHSEQRPREAVCVGRRDTELAETQRSSVRRPQRRRASGDAEKQCASTAEAKSERRRREAVCVGHRDAERAETQRSSVYRPQRRRASGDAEKQLHGYESVYSSPMPVAICLLLLPNIPYYILFVLFQRKQSSEMHRGQLSSTTLRMHSTLKRISTAKAFLPLLLLIDVLIYVFCQLEVLPIALSEYFIGRKLPVQSREIVKYSEEVHL